MSKNFRETLAHQLENDAEFRKEYEALAPEYELAKMLIACRNSGNLTQKQLSELTLEEMDALWDEAKKKEHRE